MTGCRSNQPAASGSTGGRAKGKFQSVSAPDQLLQPRFRRDNFRIAAWKANPESTSFVGLGFNTEASAHAFQGFRQNREANSSALILGSHPLEQFKNALLVFRRDADAV